MSARTQTAKWLAPCVVVGIGLAMVGANRWKHQSELAALREDHYQRSRVETDRAVAKVEHSFELIYQGIRTLARLPGVRSINRHAERFSADARQAAQEIYNNLAGSVAVSEVYISVGSSDSSTPRSKALIEATGLEVIRDEIPRVGPIGGLYTAFRQLDAEWVLLVAGDMPFLTSECLLELMAETSPDVDAVVAREPGGRLYPVVGCYQSSVLPNIESCLEHGDFAMKNLISGLNNVRHVTFRPDILRNVNRPDDLQDLRALSFE